MSRSLQFYGQNITFSSENSSDKAKFKLDKEVYEFSFRQIDEGIITISYGGQNFRTRAVRSKDKIWVWVSGKKYEFTVPSSDHAEQSSGNVSKDVILTPMPGNLLKLNVKAGEKVEEGQILAVVEAMKMEHNLRSPRDGNVKSVHGHVGQILDGDFCVITLEPQS